MDEISGLSKSWEDELNEFMIFCRVKKKFKNKIKIVKTDFNK